MKRILHILVAVATCFCVLTANIAPALAAEADEEITFVELLDSTGNVVDTVPIEQFDIYDYAVPYDEFMTYRPSFLNASSGLLGFEGGLAWSGNFAELGLTCLEGGMYILGILVAADCLVYAIDGEHIVEGVYRTLAVEAPAVFYDFISWIWLNTDDATRAWLEEAFDLYCANEAITVTAELSASIVAAMEGFETEDELGNLIDTSLSISTSSIAAVYTDGIYSSSLTLLPDNVLMSMPSNHMDKGVVHSTSADGIRWDKCLPGSTSLPSKHIWLTNELTGTSINLNSICYQVWMGYASYLDYMSRFYQVIDETGLTYWVFYTARVDVDADGSPARAINALNCSAERPIYMNGTNTILDGKSIVGVSINDDGSGFTYTFSDGATTVLPLDPIGMVISKTGELTTGADVISPSDAEAKGEDEDVTLPYCPPVAGVDTPAIGIPLDDTYISSVAGTTTDAISITADAALDFNSPSGIKGFIGGIVDYFAGLFDWLPVDFSNTLDTILNYLQTIMLLLVVVKIIDVIWPFG